MKSEAEKIEVIPNILCLSPSIFSRISENQVILLANLTTYVANRLPDQATQLPIVMINLAFLLFL